jgi:hypothetical protein
VHNVRETIQLSKWLWLHDDATSMVHHLWLNRACEQDSVILTGEEIIDTCKLLAISDICWQLWKLSKDPSCTRAPVVLSTGHSDEVVLDDALNLSNYPHLVQTQVSLQFLHCQRKSDLLINVEARTVSFHILHFSV